MYSLLISCAVAIFRTSLTRFHAAIATVTAGSPLNFYLFIYSIASFFVKKHRLWGIIGQGHIFARCITIVAGILWISLLVYVFAPAHLSQYSQRSCESQYDIVGNIYVIPLELFKIAFEHISWFAFLITFPITSTAFGWIVAIFRHRKDIWPPEERWSPQFRRVWYVHPFTIVPHVIVIDSCTRALGLRQ